MRADPNPARFQFESMREALSLRGKSLDEQPSVFDHTLLDRFMQLTDVRC